MLGIWKDFKDLEDNLCIEELSAILVAKQEQDYNEKKFLAALQGVDLDKESGSDSSDEFEKIKAKVFSRGMTDNPNDILSLQGITAEQAGFGIGMGIDYSSNSENPLA